MRAAVVTFPGSNCDDDTASSLSHFFQVDRLWHKDSIDLSIYSLVVLPGGFSYGDYLRCGAIAAHSPITDSIRLYAEGGGYLLGICNGFQILCETRLLPGSLIRNKSTRFVCRDVDLSVESLDTPWTCAIQKGTRIKLPIAHGDGRYYLSESELAEVRANGQILLTYTDNPNGSVAEIAGVTNRTGNIFGLMPHPERATDLRSRDGMKIWISISQWIDKKSKGIP